MSRPSAPETIDGSAAPAAATVDVRAHVCPMTWVRVKLALEALPPGGLLTVLLRGAEPLRNVPRSAAADGHQLLSTDSLPGPAQDHRLLLRKAG